MVTGAVLHATRPWSLENNLKVPLRFLEVYLRTKVLLSAIFLAGFERT